MAERLKKKRKIAVITGTRAEYGLLKPLLTELAKDAEIELQLIVTGAHLSPEYGLTYEEIENDGFTINEKIEILLSSDTSVGISKSMGLAMISFSEVYQRLMPDIVVVLGDRYEILAAVNSAVISRIPIGHFNGGELTEGAIDDAIRHAITKLSHLHFTSTDEYRRRIIQLGEDPAAVFNVGEIGLTGINDLGLLSKKALKKELGIEFGERNLLVTFHPVTSEKNSAGKFQNLLDVLSELKGTKIIFTKANADSESRLLNKMIDDFVARNTQKAAAFISMGRLKYLSTMKFVDAVVGNSSSGIVEAPSLNTGTINIGDRQKGRIQAKSVINCTTEKKSIREAFKTLYSKEYKEALRMSENPYFNCRGLSEVISILKNYDLTGIIKKSFRDLTCAK